MIKHLLKKEGYSDVHLLTSAEEADRLLRSDPDHPVDLILLDIFLEGVDGIAFCRTIKEDPHLRDIPVIMVTARSEPEVLKSAFEAGAMDFIRKPFETIEFLARVRSALLLKKEMDQRKLRESELLELKTHLEEANRRLEELSHQDGLTQIANRRRFDGYLESEWKRAKRTKSPLSLIMLDIDFFKLYNDAYGHVAGDECLKSVALLFKQCLKRPEDLAARYGGEEFAAVLPNTDRNGAMVVSQEIQTRLEEKKILHESSVIAPYLTVSIGAVTWVPESEKAPSQLVQMADQALYSAKKRGRNTIVEHTQL
jgi:diguanylate cyclase (GGDEF)-like protein